MPDYTLILKTFGNHRKMSSDEEAMLKMLRELTEPQRAMLVEILGPPAKAKVRVTRTAARRKVEHCIADIKGNPCNISRRGAIHKDVTFPGYHEFQPPQPATKSPRASSLAEKIAGRAGRRELEVGSFADDADMISSNGADDGPCRDCDMAGDNNVHHKRTDPDYHEFQPASSTAAATGD